MSQKVAVPLNRLSPNAKIPTSGSVHSAGSDLYACIEDKEKRETTKFIIPARGRAIIPTQLAIAIPEGHYGRIAPRSSLAAKYGLDIGAGVVDSDYRGPVGVVVFNHSDIDYVVSHGDRIAQIIITPYKMPEFVEIFTSLEETKRGTGGFGSTG